jgi:diguanylate cyclase (GGDEF)-like protein
MTILRAWARRWAIRLGLRREPSLPDAVYKDLVATLFTMSLPILGMGILFASVAALICAQRPDAFIATLAVAAIVVTALRIGHIARFHRHHGDAMTRDELAVWERGYALGSHAIALMLGALAAYGITDQSPVANMLLVSLVFTLGAGLVSRTASRPAICVTSLLMVTAPTVIALAVNAALSRKGDLNFELFATESLIVAIVTGMSIQSALHLYRSTEEHLIAKHQQSHLARLDELTGLPNRLLLSERFSEDMTAILSKKQYLALHFLDLDGFKGINDSHGHLAGDALLCQVAHRLSSLVRASDTVARLGGDEFVVVQPGIRHTSEAETLAKRIVKQLSLPYNVNGTAMEISVSIGIALAPPDADNWDELSACADAALYTSKAAGKGQFAFSADWALPRQIGPGGSGALPG